MVINQSRLPIYITVVHIAIRVSLANKAPITDCDEVYNYWEPLHFLNHGYGMQTWEYAPQFALRTYAYLLPMSYLSAFYEWILSLCPTECLILLSNMISPSIAQSVSIHPSPENKVLVFHLLRATIAVMTSIAELRLIRATASSHSIHVAIYLWVILLTSTGMFHTAPAYLPSSTVMICLFHSLSEQMQSFSSDSNLTMAKLDNAIIYGLIAVLMTGWPFCAVLFIPLGLFATLKSYGLSNIMMDVMHLFKRVIFYALLIQTLVTIIDYRYYGKILSPTINIFLYNTGLFGGDDNVNRDELYGVESIAYYVKNLILNWNIVGVLGVTALPFLIIIQLFSNSHDMQLTVLMLLPMILWMIMVFSRPHKEERFLFPIYPLLALGAALLLDRVLDLITIMFFSQSSSRDYQRKVPNLIKTIGAITLLVPFALISISRSIVLSDGYTAPLQVYTHLHHYVLDEQRSLVESYSNRHSALICTGGEWYRFPSSYHLPGNLQLAFLKSSFSGQLPQHFTKYGSKEESLVIQSGQFNDLNKEETDRYVRIEDCSYLIELLSSEGSSESLKSMSEEKRKWVEVVRYKFLDAESTSTIDRILFLPFIRKAQYRNYALFKRP